MANSIIKMTFRAHGGILIKLFVVYLHIINECLSYKFHPYSILTGHTKVESVAYQVLRTILKITVRAHCSRMAIMILKFKKGKFQKFENILLWHVGNIINFNNSTQKSIQIHFLAAFSIHEVAPFCLFCHFLLFLCSDII